MIGVDVKMEGRGLVGAKWPATPADVTVKDIRFFGGFDVIVSFGFRIRDGMGGSGLGAG